MLTAGLMMTQSARSVSTTSSVYDSHGTKNRTHSAANLGVQPSAPLLFAPTETAEIFKMLHIEYEQVLEELHTKGITPDEVKEILTALWTRIEKYKQNEDMLINRLINQDETLTNISTDLASVSAVRDGALIRLGHVEDEIVNVIKKLDASYLREQDNEELVNSLSRQTKALELEIDKRKKEQEDLIAELGISGRSKEAFYKEKERLKQEIISLKNEIISVQTQHEDMANQYNATLVTLETTQNQLSEAKTQNAELVRDKGVLSRDALNHKALIRKLKKCLVLLKTHHDALRLKLENLTATFEQHKKGVYEIKFENRELKGTIIGDLQELNELSKKMKDILKENNELKLSSKERERHYNIMKKKLENVTVVERNAMRTLKKAEKLKMEALEKCKQDTQESVVEVKESVTVKDSKRFSKQKFRELEREKILANTHLLRAAAEAQVYMKKLAIEIQMRRTTEAQRDQFKSELHKLFMMLQQQTFEKNRDKQEMVDLQAKVEEGLLDVRHKEGIIVELKKELEEKITQYKKALNMYEEVKAERNFFAGNLRETKKSNFDLKRRIKILNRQTDQLKEQITIKNSHLIKEQRAIKKKTKEVVKLDFRLNKTKNLLTNSRKIMYKLEKEETLRRRYVDLSDDEKRKLQKVIDKFVTETGILATQLDSKTIQLSLLQDKLDTMESVLRKGEGQYNQRLDDIRILRLEILKLRREKAILLKSFENMADLRNEIYHLSKDLSIERLKNRALEDEMESPINFHRWRFLEGSDPDKKELLDKIMILKKKVLAFNKEITEKDFQLEELNRLYQDFRAYMDKLPGFEAQETIVNLRKALSHKDEQMKVLSVELSLSEGQINELKLSVEVNKRIMNEIKQKYYDLKLIQDRNAQKRASETTLDFCDTLLHGTKKAPSEKKDLGRKQLEITVIDLAKC